MTLIGYWPLNEKSGTKAYDHSGNENHGTLNGGVTRGATGLLGDTAYSFDGGDDYVSTSEIGKSVNARTGVAFSAWFNLDSTGGIQTLVSQNFANAAWLWEVDGGSLRAVYISSNSNPSFFGNSSLSTDTWHHYVCSYDGETVTIYLDGIKDGASSSSAPMDRNKNAHSIGYRTWNSDRHLDGKISELRIYDRPLTQSEIQYLYSVGKRGLQTTSKKTS